MFFLFLIGGCTFNADRTSPAPCHVDNDIQIQINETDWKTSQQHFNNIMIAKNGEPVLLIQRAFFSIDIISFADGQATNIQQYSMSGKKIAKCSIKNWKPDTGTVWGLFLGLRGVKSNSLCMYKNGNLISETPYKEDEISQLLKIDW